ncbi:MAG: zinc-binding dehydrogenase [Caulobacter sp.]|nr:zinc-binding dehydrogenase [Caulobacter sp.]
MKALVQDRIGPPLEVVELREIPDPVPEPGEALVRIVAAGIHPGDFFFTQGQYPEAKRPALPGQIVGNHGVGRVVETGGRADLAPGMLVAFSAGRVWAEYAAVDARALIPLPDDYPIDRAVQLMPAITARDALDASEVGSGQWLAVTAGHSLVSTLVIQMARRRGVKVAAIVRRRIAGRDLEALGADAVIALSDLETPLGEAVLGATDGAALSGVIDAVGGEVLTQLLGVLGFRGRGIIVGAYDLRPFQAGALKVLMDLQEIRSYVYRYFLSPPPAADADYLAGVLAELADPAIEVRIAGRWSIGDYRKALEATVAHPEEGKHVLMF